MGPTLVQLSQGWKRNVERLDKFLCVAAPPSLRWAVELRERPGCARSFDVLRRHRASLCIHDLLEHHPWELTTGVGTRDRGGSSPIVRARWGGRSTSMSWSASARSSTSSGSEAWTLQGQPQAQSGGTSS